MNNNVTSENTEKLQVLLDDPYLSPHEDALKLRQREY